MVCTPEPGTLNSIWSTSPAGFAAALASRMAWRSDPGPTFSVLTTVNVASRRRTSSCSGSVEMKPAHVSLSFGSVSHEISPEVGQRFWRSGPTRQSDLKRGPDRFLRLPPATSSRPPGGLSPGTSLLNRSRSEDDGALRIFRGRGAGAARGPIGNLRNRRPTGRHGAAGSYLANGSPGNARSIRSLWKSARDRRSSRSGSAAYFDGLR